LPQPVPQLALPVLRQIIHALLTQIDALELCDVLRGGLANALHDNGCVSFEDDAIVNNLVYSQSKDVVVFNYSAFIYGLSFTAVSLSLFIATLDHQ
jgi:hypothetical protein